MSELTFVTLGTQLANPFVIGNLNGGRIDPLPVKFWYQLFNPADDVFTARIRLPNVENFRCIETTTQPGHKPHDAVGYLGAEATSAQLWHPLVVQTSDGNMFRSAVRIAEARHLPRRLPRAPRKRALLVGINEYPDPCVRLQGCVNDVFRVSATLQEMGFDAEQIRLLVDHRATAARILERLDWLVDDVRPNDQLVFYYSGHGTQIAEYGPEEVVDHCDESLVPYDFDWSPPTRITDNQIYEFYSQLPYGTRLRMIFDCCHSGGIHREGGITVRGITPPDDIRHRALEWNARDETWGPRRVEPINPAFSDEEWAVRAYCGKDGNEYRLGRAMPLRRMSQAEYERASDEEAIVGPYLPVILEACGEQECAFEYRAGSQSYGAFTYALTNALRARPDASFVALIDDVGRRLDELGYRQRPTVLGPRRVIEAPTRWT
ncbi:MAG: caspase family protein [Pirellulales bacterium]